MVDHLSLTPSSSLSGPSPSVFIVMMATGNHNKAMEVQQAFDLAGLPLKVVMPPDGWDVDETGDTFEANALLKVQDLATRTDWLTGVRFILGDDSGYWVKALAGVNGMAQFPGVYANRWLTHEMRNDLLLRLDDPTPVTMEDKCQAILSLMQGIKKRHAAFECALALIDCDNPTQPPVMTTGHMPLWVTEHPVPVGDSGFGYDPINHPMLPTGEVDPRTVAQLSSAEKLALSHRGLALQALIAHLQSVLDLPPHAPAVPTTTGESTINMSKGELA
jgi:XTP/dITP diphosphohydrolase